MPTKFSVRKISDTENRLRILLCLDALGMVTREQLWPFVAKLELMDYIPMCLFTDELLSDGSLAVGAHATQGALYLTDEGRATLELFRKYMPQSDRERVAAAAPDYMAVLQERRLARAVHELAPQGRYRCLCTILEGELPTLLLRVDTSDRALNDRVMTCFKSKATPLTMCLYTVKLGPEGEERRLACAPDLDTAMEQVRPKAPVLCAFGKHEHAAVVALPGGDTEYRVALTLPSKAAATRWALAVDRGAPQVFGRIHALFEEREP